MWGLGAAFLLPAIAALTPATPTALRCAIAPRSLSLCSLPLLAAVLGGVQLTGRFRRRAARVVARPAGEPFRSVPDTRCPPFVLLFGLVGAASFAAHAIVQLARRAAPLRCRGLRALPCCACSCRATRCSANSAGKALTLLSRGARRARPAWRARPQRDLRSPSRSPHVGRRSSRTHRHARLARGLVPVRRARQAFSRLEPHARSRSRGASRSASA